MNTEIQLHHFFISPGHNFYGHHGQSSGDHPILSENEIELVAGKGIVGDRFFDYKPDYKGQITFFDYQIYEELIATKELPHLTPDAFRRNVLISGVNLNNLIDKAFAIDGIEFLGHSECSPCYWMDEACTPGTEHFLKNRGGLRAKIITSGTIKLGTYPLTQIAK